MGGKSVHCPTQRGAMYTTGNLMAVPGVWVRTRTQLVKKTSHPGNRLPPEVSEKEK